MMVRSLCDPLICPHRIAARKLCHWHLDHRAKRHVERAFFRPWRLDPRRWPAHHLWRGHALHLFAVECLADWPVRSEASARGHSVGPCAFQFRLGLRPELCCGNGHSSGDDGDCCAVHAAGRGDGGVDRSRGKAGQRHRLCFSRLVAGCRHRLASSDRHREPSGLAKRLPLYRTTELHRLHHVGLAIACSRNGCSGRYQDLDRARA